MKKEFVCCICKGSFKGYGNNPDGAMWRDANGNIVEGKFNEDERCCDECDNKYVIPGRIYKLNRKN